MPVLSIIVPVYNVENYIRRCLDSILVQTFTDWECILIDDGSTDKSGEICDWYAVRDKRFKVLHKKNGGPGKARNSGIGYDFHLPLYEVILSREIHMCN